MPVTVDKDTCIGCGACVGVCPVAALALDENGKSGCDEDTCISCFSCIPSFSYHRKELDIKKSVPTDFFIFIGD